MAKSKTEKDTAMAELIAAAPTKALSELILNLAENDPEIRRECFDYFKVNTAVSKMLKRRSEGEAIMPIWAELLSDLEDLDAYGGGPYGWKTVCGNCCMKLLFRNGRRYNNERTNMSRDRSKLGRS